MAMPDHVREPCPDRILDDLGGAFSMGAVGGSVFHFIVGVKNSPRGERFHGGIQAVTLNAPRVGGSFAVWGGLFSTFDCGMVFLRQKEDPWNSIGAGAATGGFLQMRQGLRSATRSAIFGGVLLALIEGAGILMNKMLAPPPPPKLEEQFAQSMGMGYPGVRGSGPPPGYMGATPRTNQMGPRQQQQQFGGTMGGGGEFSRDNTPGLSSDLVGHKGNEESTSSSDNKGGLFSGLFSKKKEEPKMKENQNLDIFDSTSAPPVPNFDVK
uniref:TSA: Wollemia nobilis Ref_Wollemi_Transcript_22223_1287 transcribed RNA sequence n=1 Tax=Wollemia nobilis TaxID=56998 RepID=A0A0C9QMH1_9CONI